MKGSVVRGADLIPERDKERWIGSLAYAAALIHAPTRPESRYSRRMPNAIARALALFSTVSLCACNGNIDSSGAKPGSGGAGASPSATTTTTMTDAVTTGASSGSTGGAGPGSGGGGAGPADPCDTAL